MQGRQQANRVSYAFVPVQIVFYCLEQLSSYARQNLTGINTEPFHCWFQNMWQETWLELDIRHPASPLLSLAMLQHWASWYIAGVWV